MDLGSLSVPSPHPSQEVSLTSEQLEKLDNDLGNFISMDFDRNIQVMSVSDFTKELNGIISNLLENRNKSNNEISNYKNDINSLQKELSTLQNLQDSIKDNLITCFSSFPEDQQLNMKEDSKSYDHSELPQRVSTLCYHLNQLRSDHEQLKNELISTREQKQSSDILIAEYDAKNHQLTSLLDDKTSLLEETKDNNRREIDKLRNQLIEPRSLSIKQSVKIEHLEKKLHDLRQENQRLLASEDNVRESADTFLRERDASRGTIASLKEENKKLIEELDSITENYQISKTEVENLETQLYTLKQDYDKLEISRDQFQELSAQRLFQYNASRDQLSTYQVRSVELETQLRGQVEELQNQVNEVQSKYDQAQMKLITAHKSINSALNENSFLSINNDDFFNTLQSRIETLTASQNQYRKLESERISEIQALREDLARSEAHSISIQSKLQNDIEAQRTQMQKEIDSLREQYQESINRCNSFKTQISSLQTKTVDSTKNFKDLVCIKDKLSIAEQNVEVAKAEILSQQNNINRIHKRYKDQIDGLQNDISRYRSEISELQQSQTRDVNQLVQQNEKSEKNFLSTISELKSQLEDTRSTIKQLKYAENTLTTALEQEKNTSERRLQQFISKSDSSVSTITAFKDEIKQLQNKINSINSEHSIELNRMKDEIETNKKIHYGKEADLTNQLHASMEKAKEIQFKITESENNCVKYREIADQKVHELKELCFIYDTFIEETKRYKAKQDESRIKLESKIENTKIELDKKLKNEENLMKECEDLTQQNELFRMELEDIHKKTATSSPIGNEVLNMPVKLPPMSQAPKDDYGGKQTRSSTNTPSSVNERERALQSRVRNLTTHLLDVAKAQSSSPKEDEVESLDDFPVSPIPRRSFSRESKTPQKTSQPNFGLLLHPSTTLNRRSSTDFIRRPSIELSVSSSIQKSSVWSLHNLRKLSETLEDETQSSDERLAMVHSLNQQISQIQADSKSKEIQMNAEIRGIKEKYRTLKIKLEEKEAECKTLTEKLEKMKETFKVLQKEAEEKEKNLTETHKKQIDQIEQLYRDSINEWKKNKLALKSQLLEKDYQLIRWKACHSLGKKKTDKTPQTVDDSELEVSKENSAARMSEKIKIEQMKDLEESMSRKKQLLLSICSICEEMRTGKIKDENSSQEYSSQEHSHTKNIPSVITDLLLRIENQLHQVIEV